MDSLFHFIFSLIVGLAVAMRGKHKLRYVALIAFLSVLIDVDHFSVIGTRGMFHNVFITVLLPIVLFGVFYLYERKREIKYQTYCLLLLVMLIGHVVTDMFEGGYVKLLYPFSMKAYEFPEITVMLTPEFTSPLISKNGIILMVYFLILLPAMFMQDFLFYLRRRHDNKALLKAEQDFI